MRHKINRVTLGRNNGHRLLMLRNMATSLFQKQRITTTQTRAKELSKLAEKLITWARAGDLHAKRQVFNYIKNREVASKLFTDIAVKYQNVKGGYTRMIKAGFRKGDNAPIVIIELV